MAAVTGIVTTVAGTGAYASSGDGGSATVAALYPTALAADPAGNLYIFDAAKYTVRFIDFCTVSGATLTQIISFPAPPNVGFTSNPIQLTASSSSGLTLTFTSNYTNICTVSGSTVTLLALGTCSITAAQVGSRTGAVLLRFRLSSLLPVSSGSASLAEP